MKRTDIEARLRAALVSLGARPREQARDLPGIPDFVLDRRRIVIMCDGCAWHGCPVCPPIISDGNMIFWAAKVSRNARRDVYVSDRLRALGWEVHRFWGHELADEAMALAAARIALGITPR